VGYVNVINESAGNNIRELSD
jgi:hypothetical protein